jgi:hypothetical protein
MLMIYPSNNNGRPLSRRAIDPGLADFIETFTGF